MRVSAGVPSRTQRNQLEVIGTLGHRHIPALRLEHSSYRFLPRKSGVPKRSEKKKEFPWKMSASSWDLGKRRTKLITGERCYADGLLQSDSVAELCIRIFGYE